MPAMVDQQADDFGPITGAGTYTVGVYAVSLDANRCGNVLVDVAGMSDAGAAFHAIIPAAWKVVNGVLSVTAGSLLVSIVPLSLTGLLVALQPSGAEIQIRLTLLAGQNVTGCYRFEIVGTS